MRKLIINGDDFGYSEQVNQGIIQAHEKGILTSTSLMVTGEAFTQGVALAKTHPNLGVGLHLVLVCGKSVLPPEVIPHLVNDRGYFSDNPVYAGLWYQFNLATQEELRQEIKAQLDKFLDTGLSLTHVDGHLNLHLHPVILAILVELAQEYPIKFIRLPSEELSLSLGKAGNVLRQLLMSPIFALLRRHGEKLLDRHKIGYTDKVYGLLATSQVTEDYLLGIIPEIKADFVEIYSHPTVDNLEKMALISPRVKKQIEDYGFSLTNYL
ncbi:MAG: ChbG/HpnK family deacetylase [Gloeocapsa sp. DLM2.Bin57]|nr:MAG: ChbG/HpnK family deacetylase [Gloeocapsa sp. DLM2.Bin57]